ncbi:MAG: hypothetical protein RIS54_2286 [Verrucomicrobiota bacterium]|jgi:hypothetical protein
MVTELRYHHATQLAMKPDFPVPSWLRRLLPALFIASLPFRALAAPATASDVDHAVTSEMPMQIESAGDSAVSGRLEVAAEILTPEAGNALVYTITSEPLHGRVGLAGEGDEADFYQNKSSRFDYFAYQPEDGFTGTDTFSYTVLNETNGLVFKSTVQVTVAEPPPVVLEEMEIEATQLDLGNVRAVELTTRPNTPVAQKLPSHEDFITLNDRIGLNPPKVSYVLDDAGKPAHGTARLDRITGELTYSPNPGYIGSDSFKYYTVDEANPQLGVENRVNVAIEPIRHLKHLTADRSSSRQVDLVFVINNSPSMAAHQERLAASLNRFRQLFHTRDLDYRIGVLTTDFVDADPGVARNQQAYYKKVRAIALDDAGTPVLDRQGRPKTTTKRVASNGDLVTLPQLAQPWVTPQTPDGIFSELVKVGTNGDSNRTAFTAVYNFVANFYNERHAFLRPEATTIVVFFMDEEETRMAVWAQGRNGERKAEWQESGTLPDLIADYNRGHPRDRQTLDGYINYWVIRPFVIAKGNQRGKLEINAVVSPGNQSHRRAAELTGGTVLNIESDFSASLAELGDRIADTVAVALDPLPAGSTLYQKSLRVLVDGQPIEADSTDGFTYDARSHRIVFHGTAKKRAFAAKIDITYEEHR